MFKYFFQLILFLSIPNFLLADNERILKKISPNVFAYAGVTNASPSANSFGANCGVIIGKEAVLIIDTLVSAKEAQKLKDDVKKVTDKPIRYVVNTHYHLDHSWGNVVFVNDGAIVIGHENSRLAAPRSEYAYKHFSDFGLTENDMQGTILKYPTITFQNAMRIDLGGTIVDLSFPGPSHTDGSIIVDIPSDKVMFLGDLLFTHYHPYISEGNLESWQIILADLEKKISSDYLIIPGHGPVSTLTDIKNMKDYIADFDANAKKICAGKTQNDAAALTKELLKLLPEQGRNEMAALVESNLREKYLPVAALQK